MTTPARSAGHDAANAAADPIGELRRDNSQLEMLAVAFHRLAEALRSARPIDPAQVREGVGLHRKFLLELHHAKTELFQKALLRLPNPQLKVAVARCEREHAAGLHAQSQLVRELDMWIGGEADAARMLAEHLDRESARWVRHLREEDEELYQIAERELPKAATAEVAVKMDQLRAGAGAISERLVSWTSKFGAASD